MKTLANNFWFVAILMGFTFVACSPDDDAYGDMFYYAEKNNDPTPSDSTKNDTPSDSIDWNSGILARNFQYDNGTWPSRLTFGIVGKDKDTTFVANLPMTTTILAPEEVPVAADAPATCFVSVDPVIELDSTKWRMNESDGFYYRTITRKQVVHMNNYDCTVISTHSEAYMFRNGKEFHFMHGQEATPTKWNDTPKGNGEDIQRDGKTYTVENAYLMMQHKLHQTRVEYPEATTKVLREKTEKKDDDTPTADYTIAGLQKFLSASRVWNEDELHYADVYTFETSNSYFFVVVNFKYDKKKDHEERTNTFTTSVAKSSVWSNEKYGDPIKGCAVYDHGSYLPAIYSWNDTGFTVAGAHADGGVVTQDIFDTDAVNRGIKNMKKDNNAKPTPIIQSSCTVGDNGVWTVIGKTVGHTVSFTVMSK